MLRSTVALTLFAACSFPFPEDVPDESDDGGPGEIDASSNIVDASSQPDAPGAFGPPSCEHLEESCGATASHDCCESVAIPGGAYYRSYDAATDNYNDMSFAATVTDFRIETYEVTVGRFRAFVDAGHGTQANPPSAGAGARYLNGADAQGGWENGFNAKLATDSTALRAALHCNSNAAHNTWTDTPAENENKPINCLTWYEAFAFCAWDGGFLPTEAEWNYAAAGGDAHRALAWSQPASQTIVDCTYANYMINSPTGTFCTNGTSGAPNDVGSESPKGDGRWGGADFAGNVSEWVLDWYVSPYTSTTCNDCAYLQPATGRVYRGGGYGDSASYIRVARRQTSAPALRMPAVGVRCARAASP
jgi:formylglycine-generating enzyme